MKNCENELFVIGVVNDSNLLFCCNSVIFTTACRLLTFTHIKHCSLFYHLVVQSKLYLFETDISQNYAVRDVPLFSICLLYLRFICNQFTTINHCLDFPCVLSLPIATVTRFLILACDQQIGTPFSTTDCSFFQIFKLFLSILPVSNHCHSHSTKLNPGTFYNDRILSRFLF